MKRHSRQGVFNVYSAELFRLVAPGGLRVSATVIGAVGFVGAMIALLILTNVADELITITLTVPLEFAGTICILGMCLATVIGVSRDNIGFVNFSLLYSPKRVRLLAARMLAFSTIAVAVTVIVLLAVAIAVAAVAHVFSPMLVGLGFLFGACAAAFMTVMCVALATLVQRLAGSLLIFLGLIFIMPLAIAVAGGMVPEWAQPALKVAVAGMPTSLLFKAISLSTLGTIGIAANLVALLGLALWAGVTGSGAMLVFHRRDR